MDTQVLPNPDGGLDWFEKPGLQHLSSNNPRSIRPNQQSTVAPPILLGTIQKLIDDGLHRTGNIDYGSHTSSAIHKNPNG